MLDSNSGLWICLFKSLSFINSNFENISWYNTNEVDIISL